MKKLLWAKTLFESYKYLGRIIKSIDRLVVEKSSFSGNLYQGESNTIEDMEAVIDLIQRKKRLLSVKLLIEESIKNTNQDDATLLVKYYIDKIDAQTLADEMHTNRRTIHRYINKALRGIMEQIFNLGYTYKDIETMLENEGWIVGIYNSYLVKMHGIEKGLRPIIIPKMSRLDRLVSAVYGRA